MKQSEDGLNIPSPEGLVGTLHDRYVLLRHYKVPPYYSSCYYPLNGGI
jgi:hypothetical protein